MAFDYKILWTDEAIDNLESILDYLNNHWTQREVDNFKLRLSKLISLIQHNPELFPFSPYNSKLRKAVLSTQTTIFYEVSGQLIHLVYLFDNRQDIERII